MRPSTATPREQTRYESAMKVSARARLVFGAIEDFKEWTLVEEIALVTTYKCDLMEATRAAATAAVDIATMRLRAVGVSLDDVLEIVRAAYGGKKT